jgi:hypothetical protein
MQPANPAANAVANAPANPAANAPANAPANAAGNITNNAANADNAQGNAAANPRQNAGAQPPPVQANRAEGSQCQCIRDEVEIARRANYDRDHGVLSLSMPTTHPSNGAAEHARPRTLTTCLVRPRQRPSR